MGKLHRLLIRKFCNRLMLAYHSRICCHNTFHIRPFLYSISIQSSPKKSSRIIRSSPSKGCCYALLRGSDKSCYYTNIGFIGQLFANISITLVGIYPGAAKSMVRFDKITGIYKAGRHAGLLQGVSQAKSGEGYTKAKYKVENTRGQLMSEG